MAASALPRRVAELWLDWRPLPMTGKKKEAYTSAATPCIGVRIDQLPRAQHLLLLSTNASIREHSC